MWVLESNFELSIICLHKFWLGKMKPKTPPEQTNYTNVCYAKCVENFRLSSWLSANDSMVIFNIVSIIISVPLPENLHLKRSWNDNWPFLSSPKSPRPLFPWISRDKRNLILNKLRQTDQCTQRTRIGLWHFHFNDCKQKYKLWNIFKSYWIFFWTTPLFFTSNHNRIMEYKNLKVF